MSFDIDVDDLIAALWCEKMSLNPQRNVLTEEELNFLIDASQSIISRQPIVLDLLPPLTICGDIHGHFRDLLRTFRDAGDPSKVNYLFLGDYVDRGPQSVNTIALLLCYKIKYPNNFFMLRGNHEDSSINKEYGFYKECCDHYSSDLWAKFNSLFQYFPIAATIGSRILCLHGGISPEMKTIKDLFHIQRPCAIPKSGLLCDVVWSDPSPDVKGFAPNTRGISYCFGYDVLSNFFQTSHFDLLIRAHQSVDSGFSLPFYPKMCIITIFGASNYCGIRGNSAAYVKLSKELICSFGILKPEIQHEDADVKQKSKVSIRNNPVKASM